MSATGSGTVYYSYIRFFDRSDAAINLLSSAAKSLLVFAKFGLWDL